jgi:hypothetical protein
MGKEKWCFLMELSKMGSLKITFSWEQKTKVKLISTTTGLNLWLTLIVKSRFKFRKLCNPGDNLTYLSGPKHLLRLVKEIRTIIIRTIIGE